MANLAWMLFSRLMNMNGPESTTCWVVFGLITFAMGMSYLLFFLGVGCGRDQVHGEIRAKRREKRKRRKERHRAAKTPT